MKVLHTNFLRGWGGQSNRILTECLGLRDRGWDVLVSAPPESQLIKRSREAGLRVDTTINYVGGLRLGVLRDVKAMKALLATERPDIVHLHGGRDSWVYAMAVARIPREKRPITIRTKHNIFPVSDHPLNRWMYGSLFDSIVCISSAIVEQLAAKPYIDATRLVNIPSAIDADRFNVAAGSRERLREEFGFTPDQVVIGITGRLRAEKAHDVLFGAVPEVIRQAPEARLICFGSGSLGGEFARQLESTGSEKYVTMAGFRKDVPECLAALDIYTQPSRSEGLGTSVLEAGAARLPVVATQCGGIPDIVEDGVTGYLVPMEDSAALAHALVKLIKEPETRATFGAAAEAKIRRVFSVEMLVEKTDAHYRDMLRQER